MNGQQRLVSKNKILISSVKFDDDMISQMSMDNDTRDEPNRALHETLVLDNIFQSISDTVGDDYIPLVLIATRQIQGIDTKCPLSALCDTGSTKTWINRTSLPEGTMITTKGPRTTSRMLVGKLKGNEHVKFESTKLLEFSHNRMLESFDVRVVDMVDCNYNVILRQDIMGILGISIDCSQCSITFADVTRPMKTPSELYDHDGHCTILLVVQNVIYTSSMSNTLTTFPLL